MFTASDLQHGTEEMKRLKQEVDRASRELEKLQKRLEFQEGEHNNRVNQLKLHSKSEMDDLKRRHQMQIKHLIETGNRGVGHDNQKISQLKREIARFEAEKEKVTADIERRFKRGDFPNQENYQTPHDAIMRSPEMLHLNDQIQRATAQINTLERDVTRHQQDDVAGEQRLERAQQGEVSKLETEQQNKMKALEDAWLRESQALKSHITMYETMKTRSENQYKDMERQHKIDTKRLQEADSRHRAQHGDQDANKNYAQAGGENVLDPDQQKDGHHSNARRRGAPRW